MNFYILLLGEHSLREILDSYAVVFFTSSSDFTLVVFFGIVALFRSSGPR